MSLVSVQGDMNSHGGGALNADTQSKVFISGKLIVCVDSSAMPDNDCPDLGGNHCNPRATQGSSKVFIGGKAIHRHGDSRSCGATTIAQGQTRVNIG